MGNAADLYGQRSKNARILKGAGEKQMKKQKPTLPRNRDGAWAAMRELKTFTVKQIADRIGLSRKQLGVYIRALQKGGYIARLEKVQAGSFPYRLIKDIGKHRPETLEDGRLQKPSGRQRMWLAMKVLKRFSHLDIALTAEVYPVSALSYCKMLTIADYLTQVENTESYIFNKTKDTGLYAPRLIGRRKSLQVYDRNLNKVVWSESEAA